MAREQDKNGMGMMLAKFLVAMMIGNVVVAMMMAMFMEGWCK